MEAAPEVEGLYRKDKERTWCDRTVYVRSRQDRSFNIVHNYSYFRIETIDSFFRSVLRNLARELDLTANLRIELNDRQIESIAVDEMIDELGEKDELLKWILGYIKENIDDDKTGTSLAI